ncbi:MAG: thiamine diphosphokinase [Bacteroidales bacterium]|nr:thiamine diphosphokinase [Bacteroidales bacterium]
MYANSPKNFDVVVLANGEFPKHAVPLALLKSGLPVVCCDGAAENMLSIGVTPYAIIGDGDSLSDELKKKYHDILLINSDQETNDLTKAVKLCISEGYKRLAIVGAGGLREDHLLANISLLAMYIKECQCLMFTNYGIFTAISGDTVFESFPRQQVSVFSLYKDNKLTFKGLQYPVEKRSFHFWWEGTLNSALGDSFEVKTTGDTIVFQTYEAKG